MPIQSPAWSLDPDGHALALVTAHGCTKIPGQNLCSKSGIGIGQSLDLGPTSASCLCFAGAQLNMFPPASQFQLVWPTVSEVQHSIEGFAAGGSIPGTAKNVNKPFLQPCWRR